MLTLTLTDKSSVLAVNYSPAIDLSDGNYEFGLMLFETYHTILNVNASNNKFYFGKDNAKITIPEGSYELQAINEFLKRTISQKRSRCNGVLVVKNAAISSLQMMSMVMAITVTKKSIRVLRANYNTMKSEIKCAYRINFTRQHRIATGILVDAYIATAKMARIGHAD